MNPPDNHSLYLSYESFNAFPMDISTIAAMIKYTYDELGDVISKTYYDEEGQHIY